MGAVGGAVPVHGAGAAAGRPWLHEPALLYPGLSLAVLVPAAWAAWWMAVPPQPLPPEQLLEPVQRQSLAALCGT